MFVFCSSSFLLGFMCMLGVFLVVFLDLDCFWFFGLMVDCHGWSAGCLFCGCVVLVPVALSVLGLCVLCSVCIVVV